MSLDITILSSDGRPTWTVPLGVKLHDRLMKVALRLRLGLLSRLRNYYEDETIESADVVGLLRELETVVKAVNSDVELVGKCQQLIDLAHRAMNEDKAIDVIAD